MFQTTNVSSRVKTLFLDRDGIINKDIGYLYRPEDVEFVPGIFALCKAAQSKGYKIVVVTNQSGIARGYYSVEQFKALSKWMSAAFWKRGIRIHHIEFCPHHPKLSGFFGGVCTCRKPRPGMLVKAARKYGLNLNQALMVGDKLSDMRAATKAGVKKRFLYNEAATLSVVRPQKRFVTVSALTQIIPYL